MQVSRDALVKFIQRYYLQGRCELLVIDPENTVFKTEDRNILGIVKTSVPLSDSKIGIRDTSTLLSQLKALGEKVTIGITNNLLTMKSGRVSMKHALADESVISNVPAANKLKAAFEPIFECPLDTDDRKTFAKMKTAVKGIERVKFDVRGKAATLSFSNGTDEVEIELVNPYDTDQSGQAEFSAPHVMDVIATITDMPVVTIAMSGQGLLRIEGKSDTELATYYLPKLG